MPVPVDDIRKELEFLSDLLSTRVRTIALSVMALAWLFVSGGTNGPVLPEKPDRGLLLLAGAAALLALVVDYLQYLAGYIGTDAVRRRAESDNAKKADYNYTDLRYRLRAACFWIKQVLMIVALACLGGAIFGALF